MTDTRFATVCNELDELIDTVDLDGIGDIETLLIALFARPVGVDYAWADGVALPDLEVTITDNNRGITSIEEFPMSVVQLVRSCADMVADLGPYVVDADTPGEESADVLTLSDDELTTALQQALGEIRLFKLMYPNEEA